MPHYATHAKSTADIESMVDVQSLKSFTNKLAKIQSTQKMN